MIAQMNIHPDSFSRGIRPEGWSSDSGCVVSRRRSKPLPEAHIQFMKFHRVWCGFGWVMLGVVLVLCLMPAPPTPPVVTHDKIQHLIAFCGLLVWWRWLCTRWWSPHLALFGFAILIEILQGTCTANRHAEVADVVADSLGLLCGEALFRTPLRHLLPWLDARLSPASHP